MDNDRAFQDSIIRLLADAPFRHALTHVDEGSAYGGMSAHQVEGIRAGDARRVDRFAKFLARQYYRDRIFLFHKYSRALARYTGRSPEAVVHTPEFDNLLPTVILGSRSTDVGAGFGGRVLSAGERLEVGAAATEDQSVAALSYPAAARWDFGSPAVLRAMLAQDARSLGDDVIAALCSREFRGSHKSSRQALRLDGEPIASRSGLDRISAGVCAGCVQVTGDGLPLVLLAEHQTTGGYPVALCVVTADVARAAQVRPGDAVRFMVVGVREAADALAAAANRLASLGQAAEEGEGPAGARITRGFPGGA